MTHLSFVLTLLMGAPLAAQDVKFNRSPPTAGLVWQQRDTLSSSTAIRIKVGPKAMDMTETNEEANQFRARVMKADPGIRQLEVEYGTRSSRTDVPFFGMKKVEHPVSFRTYIVTVKGEKIDVRREDATPVSSKETAIVRRDVTGWLGVPALRRMLPDRPIRMNETLKVSGRLARQFLGALGTLEDEVLTRSMTLTLRTLRREGGELRAVFAIAIAMGGSHQVDELKMRSTVTLKGEMVVSVDTTRLVRFTAKGVFAYEGGAKSSEVGDASVTGSGPLTIRREIAWNP